MLVSGWSVCCGGDRGLTSCILLPIVSFSFYNLKIIMNIFIFKKIKTGAREIAQWLKVLVLAENLAMFLMSI